MASGFNCMPINQNKTPMQGWKKWQDEKIEDLSVFNRQSDYYGLICGYNDIECIDVDLKIFPAKQDRLNFAKEFFDMLDANIDQFKERFVIKKTANNGYHVIYRADNIEGNQKLATLNGYDEAIIETRGIGGYICMYEKVSNLDYENISKISDEERNIVIDVCRSFNEKHDNIIKIDKTTEKEYKYDDNTITPWDDYNKKTRILDVISNDFDIVGYKSDKILIRRHGAKSPHSGYVYSTDNCMYLFSTGTIYDAQTLISPFIAYAIKNHNGDYSRAASVLYAGGYGDRRRPKLNKKIDIIPEKNTNSITFPVDIFPEEITYYMQQCKTTLNNSIDYLGCSFLWVSSLIIGNALRVEVKKGWQEISTIWLAIVGEAGIGKTPSVDSILRPLEKLNGEEKMKFQQLKQEYEIYQELSKKERKDIPVIEEPKRTQFIVDDVTIEALINLHSQNPNGVGVHKDELAGWFKDMNRYKEGSDKEQWLSSWSGKGISVDRITRQSDYIAKPILPVLGGIQPTILSGFFTDENRDNGFLDRMLFSYPSLRVEKYNDKEMESELIEYYDNFIRLFHQEMRKITRFNDFGHVDPYVSRFDDDAKSQWVKYFNEITKQQNSDKTNEFLKSVLPKMKGYLPRFALILNTIHAVNNGTALTDISKKSVDDAFKLVKYFVHMNEKITLVNSDHSETNQIMNSKKGLSKFDKLKKLVESGKEFSKTQVAKELNISRNMLYKYLKRLEDKK